jgi:hypothetical protein
LYNLYGNGNNDRVKWYKILEVITETNYF